MIDLVYPTASNDLFGPTSAVSARGGSVSASANSATSASSAPLNQQQLLERLESLLVAKANEIRLAGTLGQALLTQQAQLEARIKDLDSVQKVFIAGNMSSRERALHSGAEDMSETSDDESLTSGGEGEVAASAPIGEETRKRLAALEVEMRQWDENNNPLYSVVGAAASASMRSDESDNNNNTATTPFDSPARARAARTGGGVPDTAPVRRGVRPSPSRTSLPYSASSGPQPLLSEPSSPSAASSRRARNSNQHRSNDIELATEIGTSLLVEVRRLQGLLVEKEDELKDGSRNAESMGREVDTAVAARRTAEESIEKYKEENWNLELASQDLASQLQVSQAALVKSDLALARLTADLSHTRETLDTSKLQVEQISEELEALKGRFELEMAGMRKHSAGLQRDKSDLLGTLEGLKAEAANRARGITRSSSIASTVQGLDDSLTLPAEGEAGLFGRERAGRRKTGDGYQGPDESDQFSEFDENEIEGSPVQASRWAGASGDVDELRSSLTHAQKTISTLRTSLAKEKARRHESSPAPSKNGGWEEESDESMNASFSTPQSTRSARGSARGRGSAAGRRRGAFVPSRLGRGVVAGGDDDDDEDIDEEEDEEMVDSFQAGEGDLFNHHFPSAHDPTLMDTSTDHSDEEEAVQYQNSSHLADNHLDSPSSLYSAHRQSPQHSLDQDSTIHSSASPRGESIASMNFLQNGRPNSGMFGDDKSLEMPKIVIWVDQETMTDAPVPTPIPVVIPVPVIEMSHIGIQTAPVPVIAPIVIQQSHFAAQTDPLPVPAPIIKADLSAQTDAIPVIQKREVASATDLIAPVPVVVVAPIVAPILVEFGTSMDQVAQAHKEVQTTSVVLTASGSVGGRGEEMESLLLLPTASSTELATETGSMMTEDEFEFEDAREILSPSLRSDGFATANSSVGGLGAVEPVVAGAGLGLVREAVEVGVQTEELREDAFHPMYSLLPRTLIKRESINTFGVPEPTEDEIETSAAVADAYTKLQRAEKTSTGALAALALATATGAAGGALLARGASKGKGKVAVEVEVDGDMGPPPVPSLYSGKTPRKSSIAGASAISAAPSRPTSPPPPDLLFRATSPTYESDQEILGSTKMYVPVAIRREVPTTPGAPLRTPSGNVIRPRPSVAMSDYGTASISYSTAKSITSQQTGARQRHARNASMSEASYDGRAMSVASSRTSEGGAGYQTAVERPSPDSCDPEVIHAITQTMIGEFLHKYTRKPLSKDISDKRHKRFFWVHPYTRTLYWSSVDPGAQGTNQSSAKSVCILGVEQVVDSNPFPPGLFEGSIIIKTSNRDMKLTATTRERHDMWFTAINYLLDRPDASSATTSSPVASARKATPVRASANSRKRPSVASNFETPSSRSRPSTSQMYGQASGSESHMTPRAAKVSSASTIRKRLGTAADEFIRRDVPQSYSRASTRSAKTFADDEDSDLEVMRPSRPAVSRMLSGDDDDAWEGLENVRACCDGKHDVGSLSRGRHSHHHSHSDADHSDASVSSVIGIGHRARASIRQSFSSGRASPAPPSRKNSTTPSVPVSISTPLSTATNRRTDY